MTSQKKKKSQLLTLACLSLHDEISPYTLTSPPTTFPLVHSVLVMLAFMQFL